MRALLIAAVAVCAAIPLPADDKKDDAKTTAVKKVWKKLDPVFKTENDDFKPTAEFQNDGRVLLANRGAIASVKEYGKMTLAFTWEWTEGDDESGKYPDHLAVALRTTGKLRAEWSHEIDEGILIKFVPNAGGSVTIDEVKQGQPGLPLDSKKCAFKMGKSYKVLIKDEGKKISVSVDGKVIAETKVEEGKGQIVFYDREPVAGVRKALVVTEPTIEAEKKKD